MYRHRYQVKTDADFFLAILFGFIVSITRDGKHVENGKILSQNNDVVETINAHYSKSNCVFTIYEMAKA